MEYLLNGVCRNYGMRLCCIVFVIMGLWKAISPTNQIVRSHNNKVCFTFFAQPCFLSKNSVFHAAFAAKDGISNRLSRVAFPDNT